jgi:Sulfotransferase family
MRRTASSHHPDGLVMERKYFFILGSPRSGTTMLQMALNRHSRVAIPPETAFFTMVTRSRRGQALHRRRIREDLRIAFLDPPRREPAGDAAAIRERYALLHELYLESIGRPGVTHAGEKSPEHTRRVATILRSFPDARLVLIHRDGRDVALSLSRVRWMPRDVEVGFALWLHYTALLQRIRRERPEQVHIVRYEDLVRAPASELAKVLGFLGLDDEPDVSLGSGNREGVLRHELSYKSHAFDPISADRVATWREGLSPEQVGRLERWGGRALVALGYGLSGAHPAVPPIAYVPAAYARAFAWLAGRALAQKSDEWLGTCLNPAHWTFREPEQTGSDRVEALT